MNTAKLHFALAAALTLLCDAAIAEEFSWQFTGRFHRDEFANSNETDTSSLEATYYFQPVDDTLGPLALAPFLNRSSRVSVSVQRNSSIGLAGGYGPGVVSGLTQVSDDREIYSVRGRHIWRDSGWFIGGGVQYHDLSDGALGTSFIDRQEDGYQIIGGKYFGASTAIQFLADSATSSVESVLNFCRSPFVCDPFQVITNIDFETDILNLSVRHVGNLRQMQYAVSGGVMEADLNATTTRLTNPEVAPFPFIVANPVPVNPGATVAVFANPFVFDTQRVYSLAGDLYPTDRIGVGIGYTSFSDVGALDNRYEVGAEWFFRRNIAVRFAVARTSFSTSVSRINQDEAEIRLIGRL